MIYALDIETVPNTDVVDRLPEPEVKLGNIKDPEKIAAKKDEARAKQLAEMALQPLTGRIVCVALAPDCGNAYTKMVEAPTDDQEREILTVTLDAIGADDGRVVTWNGKEFDMPYLYQRAALLGISHDGPPLPAWTRRYDESRHVDLMQVWAGYRRDRYTSLETFARIALDVEMEKLDPTTFPKLMQTAEGREQIAAHCAGDARTTYQAFLLMQGRLF